MNNFKKRYLDTFNDIHAPNSIKEEVICMSKNLNNNEQSKNSNHVVETNNVEVSNGFHYNRFIAIATCVALICGGAFGFNYLLKDNDSLEPTTTESESTTSTVDTTLNSSVSNTSVVGNDNFKDIFGVNVQDLTLIYFLGYSSDSIVKYCDMDNNILNVINTLNTSSWIKQDIIPNNNDITTKLNLTLGSNNQNLVLNFYNLKDDTSNIYIRAMNESKNIDSCYKITFENYNSILNAIEKNNTIYFNSNPNYKLDIDYNIQKDGSAISTTITDSSKISTINDAFFKSFNWQYDANMDINSFENATEYTRFTAYVESKFVYFDMYHLDNSVYVVININLDKDTNLKLCYKLTSSDVTKDYNNLTKIINLGDKTATDTTKITTSTSTTTATTTVTTPVETTVDSTTNSIINTTVVPQTDEPVTTKKVYNIATPQLDYVININNPDTLPQFLTQEQQQLLCYAYSIVQGLVFNSPFEYVQEDTIIHNNHTYSRIKSPEINTVQDVKQYFEQYLTESFIDGYINMNSFIEQNGHAYGLNGARGGNIYYLGHTFVLDSQTDDRIEFHADAYYQTDDDGFDMYTGDYFYNQEPTVPYEVRTCKYVLVKTDDGWRFDEITVLI
ncbi:MAG: DL-endopeptidase inhibitor IseA family protein [Oscillospiraceae bacterium]